AAWPRLPAPSPGPRRAGRGSRDDRNGDAKAEAAARYRAGLEVALLPAHALLEAGEAAAARRGVADAGPVIHDLDVGLPQAGANANRAAARPAVPDHVRRRLPHRPCQQRLDLGIERDRAALDPGRDTGGVERGLGAVDLGLQRHPPVAADGFAHFGERAARD